MLALVLSRLRQLLQYLPGIFISRIQFQDLLEQGFSLRQIANIQVAHSQGEQNSGISGAFLVCGIERLDCLAKVLLPGLKVSQIHVGHLAGNSLWSQPSATRPRLHRTFPASWRRPKAHCRDPRANHPVSKLVRRSHEIHRAGFDDSSNVPDPPVPEHVSGPMTGMLEVRWPLSQLPGCVGTSGPDGSAMRAKADTAGWPVQSTLAQWRSRLSLRQGLLGRAWRERAGGSSAAHSRNSPQSAKNHGVRHRASQGCRQAVTDDC